MHGLCPPDGSVGWAWFANRAQDATAVVQAVKDVGTRIYEHVVIGVGACLRYCANLSFQGGEWSLQGGGAGVVDRGPYVGWASLPAKDRGNLCTFVSGGYLAGASISQCGYLESERQNPNDWEVDIFPCGPSFAAGMMVSAPLNPILKKIFSG